MNPDPFFLFFVSVVTDRDRRDRSHGVRNGTEDVAVSESGVKDHRLHPPASHRNPLVSPVRISFFFFLHRGLYFTPNYFDLFIFIYLFFSAFQLWSSVPEAADTRTWFSVSSGAGQRPEKGRNSCKDFLIASADAWIKVPYKKKIYIHIYSGNGWTT